MVQTYQPPADPTAVGAALARNPREIPAIMTTDGCPVVHQDDGGSISRRTGRMKDAGGRRQQATAAFMKRRKDKGFEGRPLCVATEEVLPAYPADYFHTNTAAGGIIPLLGRDFTVEEIERSKAIRDSNLERASVAGAKAVAEVAKTDGDKALADELKAAGEKKPARKAKAAKTEEG